MGRDGTRTRTVSSRRPTEKTEPEPKGSFLTQSPQSPQRMKSISPFSLFGNPSSQPMLRRAGKPRIASEATRGRQSAIGISPSLRSLCPTPVIRFHFSFPSVCTRTIIRKSLSFPTSFCVRRPSSHRRTRGREIATKERKELKEVRESFGFLRSLRSFAAASSSPLRLRHSLVAARRTGKSVFKKV